MDNIQNSVLVILSLYNGEKYIKEQLDSLMNQTIPVFVLARDDGSTDNTIDIVKGYIKNHNNIILLEGENKGFVKSFNELLMNPMVDNYDWIAFCDQDDVWLPNKLEVAIKKLEKYNYLKKPLMYCSNLTVVDSNLNRIREMHKDRFSITRSCVYIQNIATGCTMVFNNKAVELYRLGINNSFVSHDYSMFCVCLFMGKVYYDFDSYILYRQHGDNEIGAKSKSYIEGFISIINDLFNIKQENRVAYFRDFLCTYDCYLNKKSIKFLEVFINYKKNLANRLNIVFNPTLVGYEFKATLAFKIRALLGRMY